MLLLLAALAGTLALYGLSDAWTGEEKRAAATTLGTADGDRTPPLLTEFGDFQCIHCARFALNMLPALEQELIEPGAIRFEYRHYPFLGPESFQAAEAAECARDQGTFSQYHDRIYRHTMQGRTLTGELLLDEAEKLGLETGRFRQCLESGEKQGRVLADREYGRQLGVRGTPTLMMKRRKLHWQDHQDLSQQIRKIAEGEMTGAPPPRE